MDEDFQLGYVLLAGGDKFKVVLIVVNRLGGDIDIDDRTIFSPPNRLMDRQAGFDRLARDLFRFFDEIRRHHQII